MKSIKLAILVFIVFLSLVPFNGCTVVGLLTGLSSDASQVTEFNQASYELHNFDPGPSMDVYLADGDTISGEFLRLDTIGTDEYSARYEHYRNLVSNEITLPQLNDSIAVNQNTSYDNIFLGFDYGCIQVKMKRYNHLAKIYLTNINYMCDSKNNCIEGEKLREILAKRDIPLLSDIVIESENTEVKVPSKDLVQGKLTDKQYGWLIGLSAGIVADALFVFIVVLPNNDFSGVGGWGE